MVYLLKAIREHLPALNALIVADLQTNVASTRLGYIWWIIDPIVLMMVYYFVIGVLFERGGEDYHLFVLSGIVLFQFFSRSLTGGMSALLSNSSLIRQVQLPLILYVFAPVVVRCVFAFIGILIVITMSIDQLGLQTFMVIPLLFILGIFSFSLSLILAAANVLARDVGKLIVYVVRLFFFLSPVLYSSSRVYEKDGMPEFFKIAYSLNPLGIVIESMRAIILEGVMFDMQRLLILIICLLLLLQLSIIVFRAVSTKLLKYI